MPPKASGKGAESYHQRWQQEESRRETSYAIYTYKVLKQVHPNTGVCSKAMSIAAETYRLAHYKKRCTVTSREIQTAVTMLLPGEWQSTRPVKEHRTPRCIDLQAPSKHHTAARKGYVVSLQSLVKWTSWWWLQD